MPVGWVQCAAHIQQRGPVFAPIASMRLGMAHCLGLPTGSVNCNESAPSVAVLVTGHGLHFQAAARPFGGGGLALTVNTGKVNPVCVDVEPVPLRGRGFGVLGRRFAVGLPLAGALFGGTLARRFVWWCGWAVGWGCGCNGGLHLGTHHS